MIDAAVQAHYDSTGTTCGEWMADALRAAASVQTDHESQPAKAGDAAGKSTDASPCECGHSKRVHVARGGYWPCPMEDCGCRHYRESALAAQPEQPAAQPVACPQCLDTGVARYPYCTTCGKRAAAPIEAPPRDEQDAKRYRWLAGDGDRAKWLLNTYSGCEVEGYIDNALRAAAQTGEPPRS